MLDRRRFIQLGAACSLLTAATAIGPLDELGDSGSLWDASEPLYAALFDDRFTVSVRFALTARRARTRTQSVRGDVTKLWYSDLQHRWRRQPVAIAGLTTYAPFLCLEQMARDHWMRSTCRPIQNVSRSSGEPRAQLYSWVIAPRRA